MTQPSLTSYALWDKVGNEYLSWRHPTYKSTREHLFGYFNHQAVAILMVKNGKVIGEMRKDCNKLYNGSRIDMNLAQKKYIPSI